jgi:hypothetical protein
MYTFCFFTLRRRIRFFIYFLMIDSAETEWKKDCIFSGSADPVAWNKPKFYRFHAYRQTMHKRKSQITTGHLCTICCDSNVSGFMAPWCYRTIKTGENVRILKSNTSIDTGYALIFNAGWCAHTTRLIFRLPFSGKWPAHFRCFYPIFRLFHSRENDTVSLGIAYRLLRRCRWSAGNTLPPSIQNR